MVERIKVTYLKERKKGYEAGEKKKKANRFKVQ